MPKKKKDLGHTEADKELKKYERELKRQYEKAYLSMRKEADKYFSKFEAEQKRMLLRLDKGEITQEQFISWYNSKVTQNHQYDDLVHTLAKEMNMTNEMARDMVTGHMAEIYAENYNIAGFTICKDLNMNLQFDLVDRRTVEKLIRDEDKPLLSVKTLNPNKDIRWNERKIRSALTQGIIKGEPVDDIAKRLRSVTKMNEEASVRTARTLTTQAECAGRQDRWEEASEEYGIEMQKTWIATLDDRTRDAHAELDGESVDLDQPFVNSIGEIMFPCDPSCPDGENVYNCRCTMITSIKKYPRDLSRRAMGKGLEGMSYEQWKREATERSQEKHKKNGGDDDE